MKMQTVYDINALFRERIGFPEDEIITFESLSRVLERTAYTLPFENMRIIRNHIGEITKESLIQKILIHHEGGLCYELNSLLCSFLKANGFQASLRRGTVYEHSAQSYSATGGTHVTILLTHEDETYLIDTGFGGNLPLMPVPFTGKTVTSGNGEFRIQPCASEHGDYHLVLKLKHKDSDWRIGYTFDSGKPVDLEEVNEIQTIIVEHEASPFNKHPLATKLTDRGSITLTNSSFTKWDNGIVTKESINSAGFEELLKFQFGL